MSVTPASVSPPKVFISYSHDDDEHMKRVLDLSDRLRAEGVDCTIDQYEEAPEQGWPRWTQDQVESADFVLVICTKSYHARFQGREELGRGRGVTWEGAIITQELYDAQGRNRRIIPTVFTKDSEDYVPVSLRNSTIYSLEDEQNYESLYRRLTGQPVARMPQLGSPRTLPLLQRRLPSQRFFCNLPRRRYSEFVGRDKEIQRLFKLISAEVNQHVSVVKGIGGVGKTSLVLEVAHRCWQAITNMVPNNSIPTFEAIIFTSSKATDFTDTRLVNRPKKEQTLSDIFREISETLDVPSITQSPKDKQQEQVMKALGRQSTLLIVDNMETLELSEYESVMEFLNEVPVSTQVVITARTSVDLPSLLVPLKQFAEADSYQLIEAHAEVKEVSLTRQNIEQIHKRFDGMPIMMKYAVDQIAQGHSIDKVVSVPLPKDIGKFCFEDAINSLQRESRAYYLLMAIAFFGDPPCKDALVKVARCDSGEQETIDGFTQLQQISFIKKENDRYVVISTVREYMMQEGVKKLHLDIQEKMQERWLKWYLEFTQKHGGDDWTDWRESYDKIEEEWRNIESILEFYASEEKWNEVLSIWEQIDNYVDLNGYWEKRLDWWTKIEQGTSDKAVKVKALSEKAWTLILRNRYQEAEKCLKDAWKDRNCATQIVRADIANHWAVLAKSKKDYTVARDWLQKETKLLLSCKKQEERETLRHQAQNLYYQAEISCLLGEVAPAKKEFRQVIDLCQQIDWKRFSGYAGNGLADLLIAEGEFEEAEALLAEGLSFAKAMREKRRVALFQASFARLNYRLSQQNDLNRQSGSADREMAVARQYISEAIAVFEQESMLDELEQATKLLQEIQSCLA